MDSPLYDHHLDAVPSQTGSRGPTGPAFHPKIPSKKNTAPEPIPLPSRAWMANPTSVGRVGLINILMYMNYFAAGWISRNPEQKTLLYFALSVFAACTTLATFCSRFGWRVPIEQMMQLRWAHLSVFCLLCSLLMILVMAVTNNRFYPAEVIGVLAVSSAMNFLVVILPESAFQQLRGARNYPNRPRGKG